MLRPIKRKKRMARQSAKRRALQFEPLETRVVLSGVVNVEIFPMVGVGTLNFIGDGSNNEVEIRQTATPGEYAIAGTSGTLLQVNGSGVTMPNVTINGISGPITVDLLDGNDTFSFLGQAAGGVSSIPADLTIYNSDGSNTNVISDVLVNGSLIVEKLADTSGYSELHILDSTVIGDTIIDNVGGGAGDTKTVIDNSALQGGVVRPLVLVNGEGQDIIQVMGNSQFGTGSFVGAQPVISITNDDGGSRTTFTGASQVAGAGTTTVYGGIEIMNGMNIAGTLDILTFNHVNVLGEVDVINGDGTTETLVLDSTLGSYLAASPAVGGPVSIFNGAGFDTLSMTGADLPWGLQINNDFMSGGTSTWGSSTQINNSLIGTHPLGPGLPIPGDAFTLFADNGADVVNLNATVLGGNLDLAFLNNGNNSVSIINGSSMPGLLMVGGSGNDSLLVDDSSISVSVHVLLNDGADMLEILNVDPMTDWPSPLLGTIIINGGNGVDTTNLGALALGALDFEIFLP